MPLSSDQGRRGTMTQGNPRPEVIVGRPLHFPKSLNLLPFRFLHKISAASKYNPRTTSGMKSEPKVNLKSTNNLKNTIHEGVREKSQKIPIESPNPRSLCLYIEIVAKITVSTIHQQPRQMSTNKKTRKQLANNRYENAMDTASNKCEAVFPDFIRKRFRKNHKREGEKVQIYVCYNLDHLRHQGRPMELTIFFGF